jgi:hypothetical protein
MKSFRIIREMCKKMNTDTEAVHQKKRLTCNLERRQKKNGRQNSCLEKKRF